MVKKQGKKVCTNDWSYHYFSRFSNLKRLRFLPASFGISKKTRNHLVYCLRQKYAKNVWFLHFEWMIKFMQTAKMDTSWKHTVSFEPSLNWQSILQANSKNLCRSRKFRNYGATRRDSGIRYRFGSRTKKTEENCDVNDQTWLQPRWHWGPRLACPHGWWREGVCHPCHPETEAHQVWSLTQFYSIDFSQSRIGVNKCVFNNRKIKVCVSYCWRCPGTSAPSAARLTLPL